MGGPPRGRLRLSADEDSGRDPVDALRIGPPVDLDDPAPGNREVHDGAAAGRTGLACEAVRVQARCISSQRHVKTSPSTSSGSESGLPAIRNCRPGLPLHNANLSAVVEAPTIQLSMVNARAGGGVAKVGDPHN
jgi:hypothetical protein